MTVDDFADSDYPTLCKWWEKQGFSILPESSLSTRGFIIRDVCACWLYLTDSDLSWITFVTGNPECPPKKLRKGLGLMIKHAINRSVELGAPKVFAGLVNKGLMSIHEEQGMVRCDEDVVHFFYTGGA